MSCLFAVTTDLPASSDRRIRSPAASRPPISSTTMSAFGRDDGVEALRPLDIVRHPVDLLPLDAAVADGRQLQGGMNTARQDFRHRAANGPKPDDGDAEQVLPHPWRLSTRCGYAPFDLAASSCDRLNCCPERAQPSALRLPTSDCRLRLATFDCLIPAARA